jgi:hypothetical protein
MTEQERADWLARAVDALIHKTGEEPDAGIRDKKLLSLVRVAESRARASRERLAAAESGHQGRVWDKVLARLTETTQQAGQPDADDAAAMARLIADRRNLSQEMMDLAEGYRDDVWARVKKRVAHPHTSAHYESGFWSHRADRATAGEAKPAYSSGDAQFDSLVRAALAHGSPALGMAGVGRGSMRTSRFGEDRRAPVGKGPRLLSSGLGLAAAAALLLAAAGPLPATGLADHPARDLFDEAANALGVSATAAPPPSVEAGEVVTGITVTLPEARLLMGLPVAQPNALPGDFALVASRYYPAAIAAREGGLFSLNYENGEGGALNIYQESESGTNVSIGGGARVTTLDGGQTAIYFFGSWHDDGDGHLSWRDGRSQSLTYAWNGVRVMIQYSGPHIEPQMLVDVASDLVSQTP